MLRKGLSWVLFFLFLILTVPGLFFLSFQKTYFNADFYRGPLLDAVYPDFLVFLSQQSLRNVQILNPHMTQQELLSVFQKSFRQQDFQNTLDQTVENFSAITPETTHFSISLLPLKPSFDALYRELLQISLAKPDCSFDSQTHKEVITSDCAPAAWKTEDFRLQYDQYLRNTLDKKFFPDGDGVSSPLAIPLSNSSEIVLLRDFVSLIPSLVFSILSLLLLLCFLLRFKPWDQNFHFLGTLLISSSILCGLFAFLIYYSPYFLKPEMFDPDIRVSFDSFFHVFLSLIRAFCFEFFLYCLYLFFLGCACLLLSRRFRLR